MPNIWEIFSGLQITPTIGVYNLWKYLKIAKKCSKYAKNGNFEMQKCMIQF